MKKKVETQRSKPTALISSPTRKPLKILCIKFNLMVIKQLSTPGNCANLYGKDQEGTVDRLRL